MIRQMRGAWLAACTAAAALALASCGGSGGAKTVQFGQVADFTGVGAAVISYGNAAVLSSEYAINAGGGILGRKVVNVPIDTKSDPADGLIAVDRALATHSIVAVNGPTTDTAPVVVPVLERHHIITLCPCGNPEFDHTSDPYFWRMVPPDPVGGETMSLYAKQLGYTRVAAVFGTDAGSQGDLPGVLFGVRAAGLHLVANIGLTPDQTSYRTQVEQLIAARPQVIFTESDGPTAATFFGELRQLGSLVPIFGTNATLQTPYLKAVASAIGTANLARYYMAEANANAPTSPAVAVYNQAVTKVSGKLPKPLAQWLNNSFVEANYDGFIMIALAMDAAHTTNPVVANNWIPKVTEPGAGKTVVYSYAQGLAALKAGKQIQYVGAAGPIRFDQWHNSFPDQAMQKVTPNGAVISSVTIPAAEIQRLA
ncbi:MAG TPA: ABC transporter substrate-binding protein [Solirubrobacteraceae bacterium]|nr:ABC transporter substrate-binding protein [Solirubrobacteraceae bacterium]